ncbi:hypothetical protein [Caballeronia sp. dw_276]|uniref:hypothetical protein n=1 Tax=Caballeronia sp. dw_276 TaxID=2719795 RepID=UPI001BD53E3E|nr:hypothetical protein [Caballeronia sp. dw_276]
MSDILSWLPKGALGWMALIAGIFVWPLVQATIRDRISKPAATWAARSALWLVTSGFRSSRDRLFRDVAQRKIEPASVTLYFFLALCASLWLGYSAAIFKNADLYDGSYEQRILSMTDEEAAIESKLVKEERNHIGRVLVIANFGGSVLVFVMVFSAAIRRRIVANSVRRFDHLLAVCAPSLSFQEEREIRAAFAMMGSYENYVQVIDYLLAKGTTESVAPAPVENADLV